MDNQFSLEPPDQGLCVGNGYVVEAVNSVIQVWDTNGNELTGVGDLEYILRIPSGYRPGCIPCLELHWTGCD